MILGFTPTLSRRRWLPIAQIFVPFLRFPTASIHVVVGTLHKILDGVDVPLDIIVKAAFNQLLCLSSVVVATDMTCKPDGTDMEREWASRRRLLSYYREAK
jgi:hypothetical protein